MGPWDYRSSMDYEGDETDARLPGIREHVKGKGDGSPSTKTQSFDPPTP